jgi:hypothetical protein
MEELRAAVRHLAAGLLSELDDAALAGQLAELRRLIDGLEAQWLRRLREFDTRAVAARLGLLTSAAWLRAECRLSRPGHGARRPRVRLGALLFGLARPGGEAGVEPAVWSGRRAWVVAC